MLINLNVKTVVAFYVDGCAIARTIVRMDQMKTHHYAVSSIQLLLIIYLNYVVQWPKASCLLLLPFIVIWTILMFRTKWKANEIICSKELLSLLLLKFEFIYILFNKLITIWVLSSFKFHFVNSSWNPNQL